jgi:hypothetical protein
MSGFYLMHRGWMDNPALGGAREPYCRRAAWAWLIENACWQDGKVDAGGKTVSLKRGQLCYSVRYLAEAWSWSASAVQRYIERLKTDTMIDTASDTGRLIITICNYEVYQAPKSKTDTPTDTVADTLPIQTRYSSDTNKKEGNKGKKGKKEEEHTGEVGGVGEVEPVGSPPRQASNVIEFAPPAKAVEQPIPPKATNGSRLPTDWTLPSEWRSWALEQGYQDPDAEAEQFRDYWVAAPGAKGRKADWLATWRTWVRRNMKDDRRGGNRKVQRERYSWHDLGRDCDLFEGSA